MDSANKPSRPNFWMEIYWFVVICLGGAALAVLVISPRLARNRGSFDLETRLTTTTARLATLENEYGAAIQAVENDPFYREEVMRNVLEVKKNDEEFLKRCSPISDNYTENP
jgi:hypothetical protein